MIPKIKKSVKKFLIEETGKVSKKSLLKMGLIVVAASSMTESGEAGPDAATCYGNHCNVDWSNIASQGGTLTWDQQVIISGDYGNLVNDSNMDTSQCSDTGQHRSGGSGDGCDHDGSEHCNCALWWCKCSIAWGGGTGDHESHFSNTHDWECYDSINDNSVDHWNAAHHINNIAINSSENLAIIAEHGNYIATVDEEFYAKELCGTQHASAD